MLAILIDGQEIITEAEIESKEELNELNRNVDRDKFPERRWEPKTLNKIGSRMEPKEAVNNCKYDGQAKANSFFKPGEDFIGDGDDFATYLIDQVRPEHFSKIMVCGDRQLRDLIMAFLNEHYDQVQDGTISLE